MIEPGDLLLERYRVIEKLGKGGFATIFKINDRGTPKVLKVLCRNEEKAISLFEREAKVLSELESSGIPKVEPDGYFIFSQRDGKSLHCLVMEFIDGENLQQWREKNGAIAQQQAIAWLKQLANILKLLHQKKYFHRDIKPSNIMLKPDGKLVLIDFGGVREITESYLQKQKDNITNTNITSTGYTSPEQADGRGIPQSDFFALGRTFVYLLTGKHPIDLRDSQTGTFAWRKEAPQASKSFADFIDRLTADRPNERPQTAKEIGQCLAKIEANSGIRWWIDTGVKSMLLVGLGAIALRFASPRIAVVCNKRGVRHHRASELAIARNYYKCAITFRSDYGEASYNLGSLYEDRKKFELAESQYQQAMDLNIPEAYNNRARLHILKGQCDAAVSLLSKGLHLSKRNSVKQALQINMARAKLCQQSFQEARSYLREAIKLEGNHRLKAECLLARVLEASGDKRGALLQWRKCPEDALNTLPELDRWMKERTREGLLEVE